RARMTSSYFVSSQNPSKSEVWATGQRPRRSLNTAWASSNPSTTSASNSCRSFFGGTKAFGAGGIGLVKANSSGIRHVTVERESNVYNFVDNYGGAEASASPSRQIEQERSCGGQAVMRSEPARLG